MHEIFEDLLGKWECKLIEFNGEENHVHLLFQYLPQMELANVMWRSDSFNTSEVHRESGQSRIVTVRSGAVPFPRFALVRRRNLTHSLSSHAKSKMMA
jgi:REP element-mobilizing transposase RayT